MIVTKININELVNVKGEALILRGCGGDIQEWVDGINELLTNEGILLEGTKFINCYTFDFEGLTCIAYPFEGVKINIGKLAIWRLKTRDNFGGIWKSDFIDNYCTDIISEDKPNKYWIYLEKLRRSGVINMFSAMPYIVNEFKVTEKEAKNILKDWMNNYNPEDYKDLED